MPKAVKTPEISEIFIPHEIFDEHFPAVLFEMVQEMIVTFSEKNMMQVLSELPFKNKAIIEKGEIIAEKAGKSSKQTSRTLKSLEEKQLIRIERPTLHERRVYRLSNSYSFLFHACYLEYLKKELVACRFCGGLSYNSICWDCLHSKKQPR